MKDARQVLRTALADLTRAEGSAQMDAARALFSEGCQVDVAHPVNALTGVEAVVDGYFAPLSRAIHGAHRRDLMFLGGPNRRAVGGDWCASVTHVVGTFAEPLFGIPPSGKLVFLRVGEFWRVEDGRVTQARLIPDLIDLMRQAGRMPLPMELGHELIWPAPATQDRLLPAGGHGAQTLDLVEAMLADLRAYDPETFSSKGQTGPNGYWAEDMFWYGPGGIGSTFTYEGFDRDHRVAFLTAFPDRVGGDHYCRIGDGDYAAVSGWPSMTMTFQGDYLGQKADGRPLTLRVMDFYRCAGGQVAENWVLLDYVDLFRQMGRDLIAEAAAL